jgi:hypothetical protein
MLINSITYYKCLCLSRIYHNPDLPNDFLQVYRIVLGMFCLYNCIINNWLYLPEFLDIFLINYIGEFSTGSNQVNMFPWSGGGNYGFLPSDYGSSSAGGGQGPSGSGGSGPPVGNQSSIDQDEDSNKSKGKKRAHSVSEAMGNDRNERTHSVSEAMGNDRNERAYWAPEVIGSELHKTENEKRIGSFLFWIRGVEFNYYDTDLMMYCNPEHLHYKSPIYYRDKSIREYNENGLKFVYHIYGNNPSCRISSSDGTTKIEIYDAATVKKYIEYQRNEVRIARWQRER